MLDIYDKDGQPIDMLRYSELLGDRAYCRVERTKVTDLANPDRSFDVSTVWLGLDHAWSDGPPVLFETMVFGDDGSVEDYGNRYCTIPEAIAGHNEVVVLIAATLTDPQVIDGLP